MATFSSPRMVEKGPMVWECKRVMLTVKEMTACQVRLFTCWWPEMYSPGELKFFVSNAPPGTSVETLLLVAFSRWRVERCFEDQKSEVGLDQYEGRRYLGLKRHLILSSVSDLFTGIVRQEERGNPELTVTLFARQWRPLVRSWGLSSPRAEEKAAARAARKNRTVPTRSAVSQEPHKNGLERALRALGNIRTETLSVGFNLAL